MKAHQQLAQARGKTRRYEVTQEFIDVMKQFIATYSHTYPEHSWNDCFKIVDPGEPNRLAVCDAAPLVHWHACDTSLLKKALRVELPEWMEEFYNKVTCAVLPMLNIIEIMTPQQSLAYEMDRRFQMDETRLPCRLIRFANGDFTGLGYSLYQRQDNNQWTIVATKFGTTTPKSLKDEFEMEFADADIDTWMNRMLRTDGHPLVIGGEDFEPMTWRRVN